MVKGKTKRDKKYFTCEECGFFYKDKKWAQKCENFCRKNKSCSLEVTKHSFKPQ